jgi:hypothetical protein
MTQCAATPQLAPNKPEWRMGPHSAEPIDKASLCRSRMRLLGSRIWYIANDDNEPNDPTYPHDCGELKEKTARLTRAIPDGGVLAVDAIASTWEFVILTVVALVSLTVSR